MVDQAIQRNEIQSRTQVEKGVDVNSDFEHSQNEDLKAQIKKLRPRGTSDPGSKPEVVKVSANHIAVHRNNSNADANEYEQMRNKLKHVQLEETDGVSRVSKPPENDQLVNGDVRHTQVEGEVKEEVTDKPVLNGNGSLQYNTDRNSYITAWNDETVQLPLPPPPEELWFDTEQQSHDYIPNGDFKKEEKDPSIITITEKKLGFDIYQGQNPKYKPSSFGHGGYDRNKQDVYSHSSGSSPVRSSSISSSSYYADIEDITKEMYELTENERL